MRRELTDWQAAQWEDHRHPRHRNKLVFASTVDLDLFAPRTFTALVGDVPVVSSNDARLAHVQGARSSSSRAPTRWASSSSAARRARSS